MKKIRCALCKKKGEPQEYYYSDTLESEEDLERHLNATDNDGKRICDGAWRYGAYGVNQVKNELKYWRLYKKRER